MRPTNGHQGIGSVVWRWASILAIGAAALVSPAVADEEPLLEELRRMASSRAFNIGALLQVVGIWSEGDSTLRNGFALANMRMALSGELDRGFGYQLQTSFIKGPAFLDAAVWHRHRPALRFTAGAFKAPFSAEFMTSAADIDFVDRAQAVRALAPGRQIGFKIDGITGSGIGYAVAFLNGNGLSDIQNDNNTLMSVARLSFAAANSGQTQAVSAGVNVAHSVDTDAPLGIRITGDFIAEGFTGERVLGGADFRVRLGSWLLFTEALVGRFDPRGGSRVEPSGYQVTLGYQLSPDVQLLGRWDSFDGDGAIPDADEVTAGLNFWPSGATEVQLNLVMPTTGSDQTPHGFVNMQVVF